MAVIDDVRALTTRLAEEPGSLAFLELAETLRRRGQLEAALKIARGGVSRYPGLADAHDLLARILCDRGELPNAFEAWADALRVDPLHAAALKGLAFLYFRAGDTAAAHDYLERALQADPDDATIPAALARLSPTAEAAALEPMVAESSGTAGDSGAASVALMPEPAPLPILAAVTAPATASATAPADNASPDQLDRGVLLVDGSGMRLRGMLADPAQRDVADAVAARLAGVSKEAARTARLLELGAWEHITVESPDGHVVLVPPTPDSVLLASDGPDVPMARLTLFAERAARDARVWLAGER